jgi:hypothetical protein
MQTPHVVAPLRVKFVRNATLTAFSLLLLVCLTACGGGQANAHPATPTPRPTHVLTAKTSPCSLVTKSQVEQILKTSVTVKPPLTLPNGAGWTSPGVMTYQTYPTAYTANTDLLIGMQYEASGESSSWQSYFYVLVSPGNLSASQLLSDVEYDTSSYGVPLVVSVNDSYLPDWQNSGYKGGSHDIAVIGYNNSNSTYTYYETCGPGAAACETSGYGTHTMSQSQLYSAIENDNGNGALIW